MTVQNRHMDMCSGLLFSKNIMGTPEDIFDPLVLYLKIYFIGINKTIKTTFGNPERIILREVSADTDQIVLPPLSWNVLRYRVK